MERLLVKGYNGMYFDVSLHYEDAEMHSATFKSKLSTCKLDLKKILNELHEVLSSFFKALGDAIASPGESFEKNKSEVEDPYLTRKQAAAYLKVCLSTLHKYVKQGKIKTYRVSNKVLIKKSELDASLRIS